MEAHVAAGLTKMGRRSEALELLILTKHFMPQAESWVERDHTQVKTTGSDRSNESNPFKRKMVECCMTKKT